MFDTDNLINTTLPMSVGLSIHCWGECSQGVTGLATSNRAISDTVMWSRALWLRSYSRGNGSNAEQVIKSWRVYRGFQLLIPKGHSQRCNSHARGEGQVQGEDLALSLIMATDIQLELWGINCTWDDTIRRENLILKPDCLIVKRPWRQAINTNITEGQTGPWSYIRQSKNFSRCRETGVTRSW